jgi:hypothetical protein
VNTVIVLAVGLLTVLALAALLGQRKAVSRTSAEVATTIERFIGGTCGSRDWDNFICGSRIADRRLEEVRNRCASLPALYPPTERGHYCSAEGLAELRKMAGQLRGGASEA